MPKPRKMLGKADSPTCLAVMQLIETQSRTTLARWAIAYAEQTCLPLYEAAHPGEDALRSLAAACAAGLDAKAIKPQLRELAALARAETDPVARQPQKQSPRPVRSGRPLPTRSAFCFTLRRPLSMRAKEPATRRPITIRLPKPPGRRRWLHCRRPRCPMSPTRSR